MKTPIIINKKSKIWSVVELLRAAKKMLCEDGKLSRWGDSFAMVEFENFPGAITSCDPENPKAFAYDAIGAILFLGGPYYQAKLAMTYLDRAIREATITCGIFEVGHTISSTEKTSMNPKGGPYPTGESYFPMSKENMAKYFDTAVAEAEYNEKDHHRFWPYRSWLAITKRLDKSNSL